MDEFFINIYISEILTQKDFALKSHEEFSNILQSQKSGKELWYHIHHFLIHISNIIKILFPKNNVKDPDNDFIQNRGKIIRENLNLSENEFDINKIGIRNDLEHYDTRIDFRIKNSKKHNYFDMSAYAPGTISGIDIRDMFRNYDYKNNILSFCGKQYDIEYLKNFLEEKINRKHP